MSHSSVHVQLPVLVSVNLIFIQSIDRLAEVFAFLTGHDDDETLDAILATKVSIADLVDNLTSELSNRALTAKQGYVLKGLIDALTTTVGTKANSSDVYGKSSVYNKDEMDTLLSAKQTAAQVSAAIVAALAEVENVNVISDEDNDKAYTYQIKIQNGKAHLIATEVE